jgi:hypothetical protein
MKISTFFTFLLLTLLSLTSCSVNRFIAPPFTDLDRILKLKSGLKEGDVSATLGIKPYDIIHSFKTGSKILIYNYRVKDRSMPLAARSARIATHSEESQRGGEEWYNTNYKELYLLFKNDTLAGVYGERMFGEGAFLEVAHLDLGGGKSMNSQNKEVQKSNDNDYLFLQNAYYERSNMKEKTILEEDQTVKKRRQILTYIAAGAAVLLLGLGGL